VNEMTCYSHSRIGTFETCKYKYKLCYIDGVKVEVPTTIEAFMGSMVHKALEKLYLDLKYQKLNTLKELLAYYNEEWKKGYTKDILINKEYTADNYRKMGEKYITDYYEHYKPFNEMTIIGLETQERMQLMDGNHYHVRIDKLGCKGDTYYVCDYKTNNKLKDDADTDRQLAMYSIWVKDKFKDAKKVVLLWHMLAFDKEITSSRTQQELDELHKQIVEKIREIEQCKQFPTNVSGLCNYCVYKSICPAFKHSVELSEKTVKEFKEDDGVKLVDSYAEMNLLLKETQDKLDEIKSNLILFAKQKDINVVYGSNKKASVREYDKVILPEDKTEIISFLKKHGVYEEYSMLNYMRLNSSILRKEMDEKIMKLIKMEKDYRVSVSGR